jgi:hypothetical protein
VVEGKLKRLAEGDTKSRIYGYGDTVDTSVLTAEDLKIFRAEAATAKKAKQKLQDELLEINVRTEIEVANVGVLMAEGLL